MTRPLPTVGVEGPGDSSLALVHWICFLVLRQTGPQHCPDQMGPSDFWDVRSLEGQ